MDGNISLADYLMDPTPTSQIFAQQPQSNFSRQPPQDLPNQPEKADLYRGDQIGLFNMNESLEDTPSLRAFLQSLSSDQSNSTDLEHINPTIHLLTNQPSGPRKVPSRSFKKPHRHIHQSFTDLELLVAADKLRRYCGVQLPGSGVEYQHQHAPILLPDSLKAFSAFCGSSAIPQGALELPNAPPIAVINPLTNEIAPSAIPQGSLELPNAPPIAVFNPLTNEIASSAYATTMMTSQNPIENHARTVQAQIIETVNEHSPVAAPAASQISPTPVTSSAHPVVPSGPKEKSKAKKKRCRAEQRTPSSSPSTSLVMEKKKQKIADNPQVKEDYALPPGEELRIQLFYQEYKLEDKKINSRDGFLVYHKKAWKFPNGTDLVLTNIEFPQLDVTAPKFKMTESQKTSTETLLDALTKGVHVYHDEFHNIYVERYCKSHVYCYTTDLGKDDITDDVLQRSDLLYQFKLEQGKRVKVFDNVSLTEKVTGRMVFKIPIKSPPPCIILSFGQTWQEGFPLSNNLVYMKITPKRQRAQYSIEETPSLDFDKTSIATSMSSLTINSH